MLLLAEHACNLCINEYLWNRVISYTKYFLQARDISSEWRAIKPLAHDFSHYLIGCSKKDEIGW
jgi:hypothetical protein